MQPAINISHLSVSFMQEAQLIPVVKDISLQLLPNRVTALVGESGSGKSVTALSILQLLPLNARVYGNIIFDKNGKDVDLLKSSGKEIQRIRGNDVSMIFQEPMTSLNPLIRCGKQVTESLIAHKKISPKAARAETLQLFKEVELPDPSIIFNKYPHQLSGGQKQRVMIAMAICCQPALLIADEPTTALDVSVQQGIMRLLKKIQESHGMAVLLITHDLGLVADYADTIHVMYKGSIVESGAATDVLINPLHNYTKTLLNSRPNPLLKGLPILTKKVTPPDLTTKEISPITALEISHLKVYFPQARNLMGKAITCQKAVDDVSFSVMKNETIGLVGESGCGKTTLGKAILQLLPVTGGKIILNGNDIALHGGNQKRQPGKELQIIFQDPYGSLNPRLTVEDALTEPLKVHNLAGTMQQQRERAVELMEQVGLHADQLYRYPHQFSGGQRQRICIARALAAEPSFLVFDESVSALDLRVQAQVLDLIGELKSNMAFTSIFISHDLSVVHHISDRMIVMQQGKIAEQGNASEVFFNPQHAYTQRLIDAIPGKKLNRKFN